MMPPPVNNIAEVSASGIAAKGVEINVLIFVLLLPSVFQRYCPVKYWLAS